MIEAVFSFNARNFLPALMDEWNGGPEPARGARNAPDGFILYGGAWPALEQEEAWFSATVDDPAAKVNLAWFRGSWFDPLTMAWRDVEQGAAFDRPVPTEGKQPTGATLFVPFRLGPGEVKTIRLRLAWYSPKTRMRELVPPVGAAGTPADYYQPWYGGKFASIDALTAHWAEQYFSTCAAAPSASRAAFSTRRFRRRRSRQRRPT